MCSPINYKRVNGLSCSNQTYNLLLKTSTKGDNFLSNCGNSGWTPKPFWNHDANSALSVVLLQNRAQAYEAVLPVWLFWGQILIFWLFFNSFGFFYFWKRPNTIWLFLAFSGQLDFLCRFGRVKDDIGRFLGTGTILDFVSGVWTQNEKFLLETLHKNLYFLFCSFKLLGLQFQVTIQQGKKFRSLLMEWDLFFWCIKYVKCTYGLFESTFGCYKGVVLYLSWIWLFWCYLAFQGLIWPFMLMTTWHPWVKCT